MGGLVMTDREKSLKQLQEGLKEIPEEAQCAIAWIVNHIKYVDQLAEKPMDKQLWEKLMDKAVEKNDTLLQALLLYHKYYHKYNIDE